MTRKKLNVVEGLKKGDKVQLIEDAIICNNVKCENGQITIDYNKQPEHYKDINIFEITRVNKNTYTCKYIEGAFKGMGFKWCKGYDLTKNTKKKYYLIEG